MMKSGVDEIPGFGGFVRELRWSFVLLTVRWIGGDSDSVDTRRAGPNTGNKNVYII